MAPAGAVEQQEAESRPGVAHRGESALGFAVRIEAERELAGGRAHEAEACLLRILSSADSSGEERRAAELRRAELAGIRGRPTEAAELAGAGKGFAASS